MDPRSRQHCRIFIGILSVSFGSAPRNSENLCKKKLINDYIIIKYVEEGKKDPPRATRFTSQPDAL